MCATRVSEGYDTLGTGSMIELSVQLALLVRKCVGINVRKNKCKVV